MIGLLIFISFLVLTGLVISIVFWFTAIEDGQSDSRRSYRGEGYDNSYIMPWAKAYDKGYREYEEGKVISIESKNRQRFGRE